MTHGGHGGSDEETIRNTHNAARFFTENRQISWVLLLATVVWGVFGYFRMPQRKDPEIPVRQALVICPWPGTTAEKIELLVTRRIEERIEENSQVDRIESSTRSGVALVYIKLDDKVSETGKEFDDIKLKLDGLRDLPEGAGPIIFVKDFGDTAALMLTVASPLESGTALELRARTIRASIDAARAAAKATQQAAGERVSIVSCFPAAFNPRLVRLQVDLFVEHLQASGLGNGAQVLEGSGFVGVDFTTALEDAAIVTATRAFLEERLRAGELYPNLWDPLVVRDPAETQARLAKVAGPRYSYRELEEHTSLLKRSLQAVPQVSKVTRSGVWKERVYLDYSQDRLAAYGFRPSTLRDILTGRNIAIPGGVVEIGGRNLTLNPSGELRSEQEIGDVLVSRTDAGVPVYLRDLVDVVRNYESPPRFLNFYTWPDESGTWHRSRAVTLGIQMRAGEKIGEFGRVVDETLTSVRASLPEDLIVARTSDQPLQVRENIQLFMKSLYEAIVLVVLVALLGFWEWRSALLMALSIPITLAMTFGMMDLLRIDLQQVSIASLIIALGLLVDDPVVAGDAVKRELAQGRPSLVAAWLGPTKLATAILFATITNIVAYLPFLLLKGDTGRFLYSLPIVIGCSLVASRIVSMTFLPFLAYYLLRADRKPSPPMAERRQRGFAGLYYRVGRFAIRHRYLSLLASFLFLGLGGYFATRLREQFFPKDLSYLSFVEIWLPEDSSLWLTNDAADRAEKVIQRVCAEYGAAHPGADGKPRKILRSLATFVGGGGPRFWFSVAPEQLQLNYAQILLQVEDKHDTSRLVAPLQRALSGSVPGARVDVRELESGPPVGIPVAVRLSGDDIPTLRRYAERLKQIFRSVPLADRVLDNWGNESFAVTMDVDSDRAALSGVSSLDVALSSIAGMNGLQVTTLREGEEQVPVMVRLRMEERARIDDVRNLYVYSLQGPQRVPLSQVSTIGYRMSTARIQRRNQFRTITVSCFPTPGTLPSEVLRLARKEIAQVASELPPGYRLEIGGEEEERKRGFLDLVVVMAVSIAAIFLALVWQFRNAVKPLIVFAAIPYGVVGALGALVAMDAPFGFMAFLGIASLVGVIVSHVIVLFDFIEEKHAEGEPLEEALLDAGIVRLRPVLITVGATVFGLIPLALHGGPLWEPLCYTQIGGLTVATVITLLLVPVLYSICVLDLKLVSWDRESTPASSSSGSLPSVPP